jgi:RNA polymerase subunit RPABC4/transcription elongation factor Spt4
MVELEGLPKSRRKILVAKFLKEMYYERRRDIFKWANITKQTPLIETKFLGQNLVSLVTGILGKGTAARGDDLLDGSEVKTCSRLDQLSRCVKCNASVTALNKRCPVCGSRNITVKKDSHWIFTINTDDKKKDLLDRTPKIYLLLIDDYNVGKAGLARFTVYSIAPKTNKFFRRQYVEDYYKTYFKKRKQAGETPAPMNVHPRSPKFQKTNSNLVFEAVMNKNGRVSIVKF